MSSEMILKKLPVIAVTGGTEETWTPVRAQDQVSQSWAVLEKPYVDRPILDYNPGPYVAPSTGLPKRTTTWISGRQVVPITVCPDLPQCNNTVEMVRFELRHNRAVGEAIPGYLIDLVIQVLTDPVKRKALINGTFIE